VEYGEPALRVVLSVPTGRFTYWMLAAGALETVPEHSTELRAGDRVACWVHRRMKDVILEEPRPDEWQLEPGNLVRKERFVGVRVPIGTPDDRRSGQLADDYRQRLQQVPGHAQDSHIWFAKQSLKPVVILGTGREHIQRQRVTALDLIPDWFTSDSHALLNDDSTMTSNPLRMLHHPFMVFDADVGKDRRWLREMVPRLVIVTSWASRLRRAPALFSRSPHVIITNRRARSTSDAESYLSEIPHDRALVSELEHGRPPSIGIHAFMEAANWEAQNDGENGDEGAWP
jgi:hypothetical protein